MGEVFIARHLADFRHLCAVKKLLPETSRDDELLARFRDEGRLMLSMRHPNVVYVRDVGCVGGEWFIEQELVEGPDLSKLLGRARARNRVLPIPIALFIVCKVLRALEYCHRFTDRAGASIHLVHRDISPANVLVSFDGEVKVIDFGLAVSTMRAVKTQPHVLIGKPGYIAPERLLGGEVDQRADLFNAGVLLFELLTAQRHGAEPHGAEQHGAEPRALLEELEQRGPRVASSIRPAVPEDIDLILRRAMAFKKEERFETATAFRLALERVLRRIGPEDGPRQLAELVDGLFDVGHARSHLVSLLECSLPARGRRQRYFGLDHPGPLATLTDEPRPHRAERQRVAALVTEPASGSHRRVFGPASVTTSP